MLLDIIIPHHDETWEICKPMIDMINAQKCVDFSKFRVWIVHDRSAKFDAELLKGPADIQQISSYDPGVSAARNLGMFVAHNRDNATWINFSDCDDCFSSIYSLASVLYILRSQDADKYDMIWGQFWMSNNDIVQRSKSEHLNYVFIHNKYYRMSFLKEHDIEFSENLWMSEDSAFNSVVKMELDPNRVGQLNVADPLYSWCRRPGSVTMDKSKWLANIEGHFKRNIYVIEEHKKRGHTGLEFLVARAIADIYVMVNKKDTPEPSKQFMDNVRKFYWANKKEFDLVPYEKLQDAIAACERDISIPDEDKKSRPEIMKWIKDQLECTVFSEKDYNAQTYLESQPKHLLK